MTTRLLSSRSIEQHASVDAIAIDIADVGEARSQSQFPSASATPPASAIGVALLPASEPVELIAFYGGDHFGLVAKVAADFERQGRKPYLMWKRNEQGIIEGLAIVERVV